TARSTSCAWRGIVMVGADFPSLPGTPGRASGERMKAEGRRQKDEKEEAPSRSSFCLHPSAFPPRPLTPTRSRQPPNPLASPLGTGERGQERRLLRVRGHLRGRFLRAARSGRRATGCCFWSGLRRRLLSPAAGGLGGLVGRGGVVGRVGGGGALFGTGAFLGLVG